MGKSSKYRNRTIKKKSKSRSRSRLVSVSRKTLKKHRKSILNLRKKEKKVKKEGEKKKKKSDKKKKYIRVNSNLYSKPSKRGGEFLLFPDYNALKNTTIDGVSNFFSGLSGSDNTQSGNVMEQPLQSGEYDVTGSKQILSTAQKLVGPEPQPEPMPQPTTCAPVAGENSVAEGSTQTSASSNAASAASTTSATSVTST